MNEEMPVERQGGLACEYYVNTTTVKPGYHDIGLSDISSIV
jgi:hypothetical protein